MSEEAEIETKELQETIEELQEERREREQEQRQTAWTRYVALTTAILAVFAAIGALQSGSMINESMMDQLRASDTWNQYQASRLKDHLYTLYAFELLDHGAKVPLSAAAKPDRGNETGTRVKHPTAAVLEAPPSPPPHRKGERQEWATQSPSARLRQSIQEAEKEREKEQELSQEARKLERESARKAEVHHEFARSVALIQVAISLSAVAALTRMKSVWWLSLLVGLIGLVFFGIGWWAMTRGV
jgi:uncharacterized protein DUF4337